MNAAEQGSATWRLFLAIPLPAAVREDLALLRRDVERPNDGWRWIAADSIHLTLRFLGDVPASREPALREVWRAAAGSCGAATWSLEGLGVFPNARAPRVLWAGIVEHETRGALARIADALEGAVRAAGFAPETRAFLPHVTIARAGRTGRPRIPPSDFASAHRIDAPALVLYRSELLPSGARHTRLDAFPFAAP